MNAGRAAQAEGARASEAPERRARIAVVGISVRRACGVRDHATLLAHALEAEGVSVSLHWCAREPGSLRSARRQMRAWTRELAGALAEERPDAVLLHYSAFAYAHRGVPLFARPVLGALRAAQAPVISWLHELAYPWRLGAWRGKVWALTQRVALIAVLRASDAVVVTADFQARWLRGRAWFPQRRALVAPVFSNLPPPSGRVVPDGSGPAIGLFGYSYEGAAMPLVLDALLALRQRGVRSRLRLLGAPGPLSAAGAAWRQEARARGLQDELSFSGALPAQELSDALASCAVLVYADTSGPTSRKGTLAASLASGRPVVAVDGPRSWDALARADALALASPRAEALADALAALLADERRREGLGARGREFAAREMGLRGSVDAALALLDACAARR